MLTTRLITIQTSLLQIINYFNYTSSVRAAANPSFKSNVTDPTKNLLKLSAFVEKKECDRDSPKEGFPEQTKDKYVPLATFEKFMKDIINTVEKKLSTARLQIATTNNGVVFNGYNETTIEKKDFKFVAIKESQGVDVIQICIKESKFGKIFQHTSSDKDFKIEIFLVFPDNEKFRLLTIKTIDNEKLDLYWSEPEQILSSLRKDVRDDLSPYDKRFEFVLMDALILFKKEIDEKSMKTTKTGNKINLYIDRHPTVLLYYTESVPYIEFFKKFTMTLKPLNKQQYDIKEVSNFKCKPSVLIEFDKKDNANQDYFNIQIIEYTYSNDTQEYIRENDKTPISYGTINFSGGGVIASKPNGIDLYIKIVSTRETSQKIHQNIIMSFSKNKYGYDKEAYTDLENSIDKVIIEIPGTQHIEVITIEQKNLKITNTGGYFIIDLNLEKLKESDSAIFEKTVKEKSCVLGITARSKNQTIIDGTICLKGNKMITLTSNILKEQLNKYRPQNDGSNSNKNKNRNRNRNQNKHNTSSPKKNKSDEGFHFENLYQNVDSKPPQQVQTKPPQQVQTTLPQQVETTPPQQVQTTTDNKLNDSNTNLPLGGVPPVSNAGSSKLNQTFSNGEWVKDLAETEKNIITSGDGVQGAKNTDTKKKEIPALNDNSGGKTSNTGKAKGSDNTNPTKDVEKTKTTDDSKKIKPEPEKKSTEFEEKPEKEEEKSGNKTIIIMLVVGGIIVSCGLIAYLYLS